VFPALVPQPRRRETRLVTEVAGRYGVTRQAVHN
jgi:hypothetical protein